MELVGALGQFAAAGRTAQPLGFACFSGTFETVVLPAVVGIPQPSNFVLRMAGVTVFLVGLPPAAASALRGREVTACGLVARFFGSGPFAGQSVLGLIPLFLL